MLEIVPVESIPTQVIDVPLDDLPKVYKVCTQLRELCERSQGVGISAVQAGIPWKLFLVRSMNKDAFKVVYRYFINCEYSPDTETKMLCVEGCLSLKRKNKLRTFQLLRYEQVKVNGYELLDTGTELELVPVKDYIASQFEGTIFQHEIDHQNQILISDIGEEIELRYR